MYTFQFSIEGLAAWLASKFNDPKAPFVRQYVAPEPATSTILVKLVNGKGRCLRIEENGYAVYLLDFNELRDIRMLGLQQWLAVCELRYTSYYVEGRRVLEFRRNNGQDDIAVAYAVDNKPALIVEFEIE